MEAIIKPHGELGLIKHEVHDDTEVGILSQRSFRVLNGLQPEGVQPFALAFKDALSDDLLAHAGVGVRCAPEC